MRSDRERIADILESIAAIDRYKDRGREVVERDELLRVFVLYHLQVIGEAASELSEQFRADHPDPPWRQMIGMRHRLVHSYFQVNANIVWTTVADHLPPLRIAAEAILAEPEASGADPVGSP